MKVSIFGAGYVGLPTALSLAAHQHQVILADIDVRKIQELQAGNCPIYEEGLDSALNTYSHSGSIQYTNDLALAVMESDVLMIAVGTPSRPGGEADLRYVESVARSVGEHAGSSPKLIVTKSTVPVGTGAQILQWVSDAARRVGNVELDVLVSSNPEFLREGFALYDATNPERIVIGGNARAKEILRELYQDFTCPIIETSLESAELAKYACNAFLATKISFINEIANLCGTTGANVGDVAKVMGADSRIGHKFLNAGMGWGGSCFPKDVQALLNLSYRQMVPLPVVSAASEVNKLQKLIPLREISKAFLGLEGVRVGLLGLTFKPNTDDIRDSPALELAKALIAGGAIVTGFDPQVKPEVSQGLSLKVASTAQEVFEGADAIVLCTEWSEFLGLDYGYLLTRMENNFFFDGRNLLDSQTMKDLGFYYKSVGRS